MAQTGCHSVNVRRGPIWPYSVGKAEGLDLLRLDVELEGVRESEQVDPM